jgi:hypothetical protein
VLEEAVVADQSIGDENERDQDQCRAHQPPKEIRLYGDRGRAAGSGLG